MVRSRGGIPPTHARHRDTPRALLEWSPPTAHAAPGAAATAATAASVAGPMVAAAAAATGGGSAAESALSAVLWRRRRTGRRWGAMVCGTAEINQAAGTLRFEHPTRASAYQRTAHSVPCRLRRPALLGKWSCLAAPLEQILIARRRPQEEAAARAQEDAANAGKSPAQHAQDQIDLATGTPGAGSGQTGGPGIGHEATHTVQQGSSGQSSKPPKSS